MKQIAAILVFTLLQSGEIRAAEPLRIAFYDVQGTSAREILKSLNDRGPVGKDGVRYHAYTSWHVRWTYRFASKGKLCEIQSLETEPSGVMTLPKWDNADRASTNLRQEWQRYSAALRVHEDGHYKLGVSAAKDIKQRLSRLTSAAGCKALQEEIDSKASAVIAEFLAKELEYDATSKHGSTQGARFFP